MNTINFAEFAANFHFLRPDWLWLLLPLMLLIGTVARRGNSGDWHALVDKALLPHLLQGSQKSSNVVALSGFSLAGLLGIFAQAGPVWQEIPQPLFRNQTGLVIALDLSRSMQATDLKPDRQSRARFKINDMLNRPDDGQIALLVYAADAFTVTPLTDDRGTLALQLPSLSADLMPAQGSNPLAAISLGKQLLEQAGLVRGQIWLLSDGLPVHADLEQLVAAAGDYQVSVLGIGTAKGAPIATEQGFLKDRAGNIVIAKLDEAPLRQLAARSGGRYARLSGDSSDLDHLINGLNLDQQADSEQQLDRRADLWQEQGPWLLLPLLLLVAGVFRRGLLMAPIALGLAIASLLFTPSPAMADQEVAATNKWQQRWTDLWQTPDQQAQHAFDQGNNATAIKKFNNPDWQAAARYRDQDYAGALDALSDQPGHEASYNRGNAKAQLGDYQGAVDEYDQVLEADPDNEDARFNRNLVNDLLAQQEQEKQPSDQDQQGDGEPSEDQQSEDGQQSDQDSQQQSDNSDQPSESNSDQDSDQSSEQNSEQSFGQEPADDTAQDSPQDATQPDQNQANQSPTEAEKDGQQDEDSQAMANDEIEQQEMDQETRQATEQWLRRIPDDPGGLLRRKFKYQYQRRSRGYNPNAEPQGDPW